MPKPSAAQPKFYRHPSLPPEDERPAYRPVWDVKLALGMGAVLAGVSFAILLALPAPVAPVSEASKPSRHAAMSPATKHGLQPLSPQAERELLSILTRE